jgi:uncharacterized membrane protein
MSDLDLDCEMDIPNYILFSISIVAFIGWFIFFVVGLLLNDSWFLIYSISFLIVFGILLIFSFAHPTKRKIFTVEEVDKFPRYGQTKWLNKR